MAKSREVNRATIFSTRSGLPRTHSPNSRCSAMPCFREGFPFEHGVVAVEKHLRAGGLDHLDLRLVGLHRQEDAVFAGPARFEKFQVPAA